MRLRTKTLCKRYTSVCWVGTGTMKRRNSRACTCLPFTYRFYAKSDGELRIGSNYAAAQFSIKQKLCLI